MKRIILLVCFLSCLFQVHAQVTGDYQSTGAVTLTSATNWQTYNGSAWVTATVPPNGNVASGNTITILPTHAWTNTSASTIPAGVTLIHQGTTSANLGSTLTINGTYIHYTANASSTVTQVFTAINTTTGFGVSSTMVYRASASFAAQPVPSFGGRTYNNLTFDTDGTGTPSTNPGPGSAWTVNGTLTVSGWTLNFNNAGSTALATCNGNIVLSSGTVFTAKNLTLAVAGTLTINSGCTLATTAGATMTINGTIDNKSTIAIGTSGTTIINGTYIQNADGNGIPKTNTTYSTGSTVKVFGTVNTIPSLPTNCYNVIWNTPSLAGAASNTYLVSPSTTTINGDFNIISTGAGAIFQSGTSTVRTLNVVGNLNISGGSLKIVSSNINTGVDQTMNIGGNLNISGGTFYLSDATSPSTARGLLNLTGNLNHTAGVFGVSSTAVANSGILTFTGNNTDKTITTTGISNGLNIVVDKTASGYISLATNMSLGAGSTLNVTTGAFKSNGFTTTLKSTSATNSTRVYVSAGASIDQSVSGSKFTIEQYIPGGTRAYRFFGHPFSSSINLSELTDDIDITGNDGDASVAGTGFSATGTNNPSAYWYDPTTGNGSTSAGWTAYTRNDGVTASVAAGSTSNIWNVGQGMRALVRGPKGQSGVLTSSPTPLAATINMSGKINDGNDVVVTLTKGTNSGYNLISNPYCAPLDVFQFRTANSNANATSGTNFYIWTPTGGVNGRGQYITGDMTASGETYRYLPAYSSFFVNVAATTTATFKEAHKAGNAQAAGYNLRTATTSAYGNNTMQLQLSRNNAFEDRLLLFFNDDRTKASLDATDAVKLDNSNLNFYTLSEDGKHLAIDRRPLDKTKEVIVPLGFVTSLQADYSIDAKDVDAEAGTDIYLRDRFLNSEVKLAAGTTYPFTVTGNAASQGEGRFELVFKSIAPVIPVALATQFEVKLSPNPVSDVLLVSFSNKELQATTISIANINGQVVKTIDAGKVQTGQVNIDVKKWAKGTYYITLSNGTEKATQPVQVQ